MWFISFFSTYGVSFGPCGVGYRATKVFDSRWMEYFLWSGYIYIYIYIYNYTSYNESL